jgi:uncharacterized protein (TIGR04255 family)
MKVPKKITPCPIVETIVEIRFDTNVPGEAVFGIVYNEFKKDFPKTEKLPILQLPENIRGNDPNLIHSPCYKLKNEELLIQVGSKVFSLVNVNAYIGWESFSKKIYDIFGRLFNVLELNKIYRLAVRYVNLFKDQNIFKESKLKIFLGTENFFENEINFISNVHSENCTSRLMIVNHGEVIVNGKLFRGSLVDIDTVIKTYPVGLERDISLFNNYLEKAHIDEKELFFSLLSDELLESLNPEY